MIFKYKLANPNTCWWSNTKGRYRKDLLLGFTRTYHRPSKTYIYRFTCGRFTIGVIF